ncbi:MAG TPA: ABC transporter permease [Caulobacterales bacterium]|nr:ABC transporter permease [Caulobacterales bacterium]
MTARSAAFDLSGTPAARVLKLRGDWTVWTVGPVDAELRALSRDLGPGVSVDIGEIGHVDVAGAYLIDRTVRGASFENTETPLDLIGDNDKVRRLLQTERAAIQSCPTREPHPHGFIAMLARTGHAIHDAMDEGLANLSFLGATLTTIAKLILHLLLRLVGLERGEQQRGRMRWAALFHTMEVAGLNALAIIALLSFFIGAVVAFLGARVLQDFGATIFTVELVAFSMLREFAVVITAVLLAGRTNSAFTAELGAMKMRQEIDALRVLGVDPMEALVAPRVLAMLFMTPVLTFVAVIAGLIGGMLVCQLALNISPVLFLNRIQENVPVRHFWVGMIKAPVFAVILAVVACRHGLNVGGDVASLGKETTSSVVQAIFLVIVVDAIFALWFMELDW